NNTQVSAGEVLALNSGKDTNLIGANASGKQVIVDVAGDLNIESVQDTATSKANQNNTGISASMPIGAEIPSVSISNSKQKSNSNYASVYQQSGIKAGEEGFDITVAGNTDLKGALIESTANADRNQLTTGTLTVSNIENYMDAKASTRGMTLSSDMMTSKYAATKGLVSNLQNYGEADVKDSSTTLSAVSPASITIIDEATQIALTDKNAEETIAALNRDTSDTNRVLARPDMEALQEKAQQEQADRLLLSSTISTFTDEAFKKMFLVKAEIFEVARDDEGKVVHDSDGNPIMYALDETEKLKLKENGENKKINVFTNGLFNDESAAASYSVQMSEAPVDEKVYLVYFPEANNFFSELLIAGYQKSLESAVLGNTNATQEIINLSQIYGQDGLNLVGHSRGAMTIGNALETLQTMGLVDPLSDTSIKFVGPAYSAQEAANSLDQLSGGNQTTVELQNHAADFVGRLIGGNQATYGEVPEGSSLIKEWINIFGQATSTHSCYGGASDVCGDTYGKPISVNIPARLGVEN
ncbi:surface adhesin, partial [Methylophaga lonarensis MPL]